MLKDKQKLAMMEVLRLRERSLQKKRSQQNMSLKHKHQLLQFKRKVFLHLGWK